ncbi:hypothetical protein [Jeotgalibacillus aurantiacus]|nr:hypothetical protein [Jeotgalibacillus aurantiacus]
MEEQAYLKIIEILMRLEAKIDRIDDRTEDINGRVSALECEQGRDYLA